MTAQGQATSGHERSLSVEMADAVIRLFLVDMTPVDQSGSRKKQIANGERPEARKLKLPIDQ